MKNIFLTGDTHFSHYNIIKYCKRPVSIAAHDDFLITRWNNIVKKGDLVYHLGDFAMIKEQSGGIPRMKLYRKLRMCLNGKIILIKGNHAQMSQEIYRECFAEIYDLKEISIDGTKLTACHFPMRSWNGIFHGRPHIFGHVHGRLEGVDTGVSCDVGVDVPEYNYSPAPWEIVKAKLLKKYEIFSERYKTSKKDLN